MPQVLYYNLFHRLDFFHFSFLYIKLLLFGLTAGVSPRHQLLAQSINLLELPDLVIDHALRLLTLLYGPVSFKPPIPNHVIFHSGILKCE